MCYKTLIANDMHGIYTLHVGIHYEMHYGLWVEFLSNAFQHLYTTLNIINIFEFHKNVFSAEISINSTDILLTWSHKIVQMHSALCIKITENVFLIFSNKVEKYLWIRFVCMSVRSWSSSCEYSSNGLKFMYIISLLQHVFPLKLVRIRLMIRIQKQTKIFQNITVYGRKLFTE